MGGSVSQLFRLMVSCSDPSLSHIGFLCSCQIPHVCKRSGKTASIDFFVPHWHVRSTCMQYGRTLSRTVSEKTCTKIQAGIASRFACRLWVFQQNHSSGEAGKNLCTGDVPKRTLHALSRVVWISGLEKEERISAAMLEGLCLACGYCIQFLTRIAVRFMTNQWKSDCSA